MMNQAAERRGLAVMVWGVPAAELRAPLEAAGFLLNFSECQDAAEAARLLTLERPEVIIGPAAPDGGWQHVLEAARAQGNPVPLVLLADGLDAGAVLQLIRHGAADCALSNDPAGLAAAVQHALARAGSLSDRRFAELMQAAPDSFLEVDREGRIVLANAIAQTMFGYTMDELLCQRVEMLMPDGARQRHTQHRYRYDHHPLTRPMGSGLDLEAQRKDGTRFPVEISLSPVRAADGLHTMAIIRDVTERREAQREIHRLQERYTAELSDANRQLEVRNREVERANRLKSEFLASMSHELRTPLHTIIGFSELLQEELEGPLNDRQKRFVGHIHRDSQHLLELINDILDLSKIEAGRMELKPERFDPRQCIEEVLAGVRPLGATKSLQLEVNLGPLPLLEADRVRVKEILYNLLSNAVKFTPEKGKVWVNAEQQGDELLFTVGDTGVGIAADDQQAIFDVFRQVGNTTKGVREGTGLGLAITKRLVEMHGGRIWLDSQPGNGSRFHFSLPVSYRGEKDLKPRPQTPKLAPLVLIVEDEASARELLVSYLEPQGYRTAQAVSAQEAVEKAISLKPAAITLDLCLPANEGWNVLRELRQRPETANIPVLVVSVMDEDDNALRMGATAYLVKPVRKDLLLSTLDQHIQRRPGGPERVLVVDDEADSLHLIETVLNNAGYLPVTASNGYEALQALAQHHVGAAIVDLMMPEMNGFELIFRIKSNPKTHNLPLVVLTAKDLSGQDFEVLQQQTKAVFLKGRGWREDLVHRLRGLLHTNGVAHS